MSLAAHANTHRYFVRMARFRVLAHIFPERNFFLPSQITGISTLERLRMCMAPIRKNNPEQASVLYHFACQYAARLPVHPPRYEGRSTNGGDPQRVVRSVMRDTGRPLTLKAGPSPRASHLNTASLLLTLRPLATRAGLVQQLMVEGVLCDSKGRPAESIAQIQGCMEDLEQCHTVLTLWLWLSYRLDDRGQFAGRDSAMAELAQVQVRERVIMCVCPLM